MPKTCQYIVDGKPCGCPAIWKIGKTPEDSTVVCEVHRVSVTMDGDSVVPIEGWDV